MHFNKSPHASEHIYYPFLRNRGAHRNWCRGELSAGLTNELRWKQGLEIHCMLCILQGDFSWAAVFYAQSDLTALRDVVLSSSALDQ